MNNVFRMYNKLLTWFTSAVPQGEEVYHAQEIWWCAVDGGEQPVLVFRKLAHRTFWGLPLTSREKGLYVIPQGHGTLSRMRVLDSQSLVRRLSKMSGTQFGALNTRVILSLQETDPLRPRTRRTIVRRPLQPAYRIRPVRSVFSNPYALKPAV